MHRVYSSARSPLSTAHPHMSTSALVPWGVDTEPLNYFRIRQIEGRTRHSNRPTRMDLGARIPAS